MIFPTRPPCYPSPPVRAHRPPRLQRLPPASGLPAHPAHANHRFVTDRLRLGAVPLHWFPFLAPGNTCRRRPNRAFAVESPPTTRKHANTGMRVTSGFGSGWALTRGWAATAGTPHSQDPRARTGTPGAKVSQSEPNRATKRICFSNRSRTPPAALPAPSGIRRPSPQQLLVHPLALAQRVGLKAHSALGRCSGVSASWTAAVLWRFAGRERASGLFMRRRCGISPSPLWGCRLGPGFNTINRHEHTDRDVSCDGRRGSGAPVGCCPGWLGPIHETTGDMLRDAGRGSCLEPQRRDGALAIRLPRQTVLVCHHLRPRAKARPTSGTKLNS